ncbi:HEAT repeat domain-containing protein [Candidatus Poribacteria bacterium]|jgi:HEAT repeat protein|nr:HEAT repeat domain-containing protein [Candidatus Poribacteria bacterium]
MPKLLNDQAMWDFVVDGYTTVQADLDPEVHAGIHRDTAAVFRDKGNLGNGILAEVPALLDVFQHPNVTGALSSILGAGYRAYPHRHCHLNQNGSDAQPMHLDSYEADENNRHHRSRWAMAFYYCHDVDEGTGPTSVVPGGQYQTTQPADEEVCFTGSAGSVCIVHYDSWHRATANLGDTPRYMHKWLFIRTEEPQRPSWDHAPGFTPDVARPDVSRWDDPDSGRHADLWRSVWNWHCGLAGPNGGDGDAQALCEALRDTSETVRLNAGYALARLGAPAVEPLIEALRDEAMRRLEANLGAGMTNPSYLSAGYALSALGAPAVPALQGELGSRHWPVRAAAANILGDIGVHAEPAAGALSTCLTDGEPWVRRNAAEALGHIGAAAGAAAHTLGECLTDNVEWVRLNAAVALTRLGPAATAAVPALMSALEDDAYYVRANAAHALDAIGTTQATRALRTYRQGSSDY